VCACRHGKIQSVRLVRCGDNAVETRHDGGAVVAFMDIRCASRAHDSVNVLDGATLVTAYNESSTTPAPVTGPPLTVASAADTTPPSSSSSRDARRLADRRSPGLNGGTSSSKCHRRSDGYVDPQISIKYSRFITCQSNTSKGRRHDRLPN